MDTLRLAILGTRGVPARYGGFETFAEQLSTRLAARGHSVTVYRRSRYAQEAPPAGVRTVTLPAVYTKYLETVSHGLLSALHCSAQRPDVALVCNAVNASFLPLLSQAGIRTILNVDGMEWQRRKWNILGRAVHGLSEHLAIALADVVIADAQVVDAYYRRRHRASTVFIPYGGDLQQPDGLTELQELGLEPLTYDLCVCRFEPENNPLTVVQAHGRLGTTTPLVMVGGATYAREYETRIREAAGPHVLFCGFRFGDAYRQLLFNARLVVYAGEVGGTHPFLLEAMGAGRTVIYNDTPENREAVADAGLPYRRGSLAALVAVWRQAAADPRLRERCRKRATERVNSRYRWQRITDCYERLLLQVAGRGAGSRGHGDGHTRTKTIPW